MLTIGESDASKWDQSVAGVEGEYRTQGADAVIGIRMLKQELDSDTNRERRGNRDGHPEEDLVAKGAVRKNQLVKVLGDGELTVAVQVTVDKFTGSAKEKIAAAGGSATEL